MFLKNPIIIIDGPDCTGKTTLSNKFKEKFDCHYIHSTYKFKKWMHAYHWAQLYRAIELSRTKAVIIDRLWLSEKCYAEVYRGGSKFTYFRAIERFVFDLMGATLIVTASHNSNIVAERHATKISERFEMYHSGMDKINDEFLKELKRLKKQYPTSVRHYTIEDDGDDLDRFVTVNYLRSHTRNLRIRGEAVYDATGTDDTE